MCLLSCPFRLDLAWKTQHSQNSYYYLPSDVITFNIQVKNLFLEEGRKICLSKQYVNIGRIKDGILKKTEGKGDYGWKAHNEKWICIGSGTRMRWPDSIHKKSDKTAAWVVQHSGTKIRHGIKDCFGWEGWEAQTFRLEDDLAIPTHLLKSSLEWGKCTVCSCNSIPTAASQMAFASLWGCGVVR